MVDRADTTEPEVVAIGPRSGLTYVHLQRRWAADLAALEVESFPTALYDDLYHADDFEALADEFPEGCFVGLDDGEPVAAGTGVRLDFDLDDPQHREHELLGRYGSASGHDPDGDWYYGTDILVRADHRRMGIGRELYELRKGVCRRFDLLGIVAGGVIPGYADHKDRLSADEYIAAVTAGELYDPTLTFQLENGFEAPCALADYIRDPAVDDYAALLVWHNPDHRPAGPS